MAGSTRRRIGGGRGRRTGRSNTNNSMARSNAKKRKNSSHPSRRHR